MYVNIICVLRLWQNSIAKKKNVLMKKNEGNQMRRLCIINKKMQISGMEYDDEDWERMATTE